MAVIGRELYVSIGRENMGFSKLLSYYLYCPFVFFCVRLSAQAGYIDNGDGTVTDNGTGLMWQQATAPGTYTWEQALVYCENLDLANHTDWRLPTVKELGLLSIIAGTTRQ